jgi:septal ring factor EnvC (AmiA/AmiB activator)
MSRAIERLKQFVVIALLLCTSAAGAAAESADSAQARAKLAAVRSRIAALTNRLGLELKQRDTLNARLREADLEITAKRTRLDSLHAAELDAERRRRELRAERTRTETALEAERAALAAQARTAYMIGQQEQMRILLNQTNPAEAGRMLTLYGYFARERAAKIDEIDARAARLQQLATEIDEEAAKLKTLADDVGREVAGLEHARAERALALAALAKQVSSGNLEMGQLKREEQAVESLIADLAQVMQDFPIESQQSFGQLRGRLPWPVPGRMTTHYQESRANATQPVAVALPAAGEAANVRWNGVMIETAPGAKVRAPYFGRVIYADWLQGLGLLIIIGHSGNYMTLYGHAEVLYKSVGDWVAPGDVIAAVGDAGAVPPQLYFEIRDGRKPVDPKIWLKSNP